MKDYTIVDCSLETPVGWDKLVEQMLDDIAPVVAQHPDFKIIQIKEKYNRLVVYTDAYIPEVEEIISKYEMMAGYVCANCGAPATKEMRNYVLSYCDDCWKGLRRHDDWVPIEPATEFLNCGYSRHGRTEELISFKEEWERLYNGTI